MVLHKFNKSYIAQVSVTSDSSRRSRRNKGTKASHRKVWMPVGVTSGLPTRPLPATYIFAMQSCMYKRPASGTYATIHVSVKPTHAINEMSSDTAAQMYPLFVVVCTTLEATCKHLACCKPSQGAPESPAHMCSMIKHKRISTCTRRRCILFCPSQSIGTLPAQSASPCDLIRNGGLTVVRTCKIVLKKRLPEGVAASCVPQLCATAPC